MNIEGVIFDLDGVILSTDDLHYRAWKEMATQEGIPFDREDNHRLRGVSRMESLEIILEKAKRSYSAEEKAGLASRKNDIYRKLLEDLTPAAILPGVLLLLLGLKAQGVKIAIGSSSRNTPLILRKIGLLGFFDAVADGNDITHSKPDPEVFVLAARRLQLQPEACLVVEDALAGLEAALAARMRCLGVGAAAEDARAHLRASDLSCITPKEILAIPEVEASCFA